MDMPEHKSLPLPQKRSKLPDTDNLPKIKIFISYTREDEDLLLGLHKQLGALEKQGIVEVWSDRYLGAGAERQDEIFRQLNTAHIILLLISPDFIASDDCTDQVERAMERHRQGAIRVLPVILRPCIWQATPFAHLQVLPEDATPVRHSQWHSTDDALLKVAEGIRTIIEELRLQTPSSVLSTPNDGDELLERQRKSINNTVLSENATTSPPHIPHSPQSIPIFAPLLVQSRENISSLKKTKKARKYIVFGAIICLIIAFGFFGQLRNIFFNQIHQSRSSNSIISPVKVTFIRVEHQLQFIPNISAHTLPDNSSSAASYTNAHVSAPLYHVYFEMQNQATDPTATILIDSIQLKVVQIRPLQRPVPIWNSKSIFQYESSHKYEALYAGETDGYLKADHIQPDYVTTNLDYVILRPQETEHFEIHVISRQEVDLLFAIQITYTTLQNMISSTLSIPSLFEIMFIDSTDVKLYTWKGSFFTPG